MHLSFNLIGQLLNKRFYVTEIVLQLELADVTFRAERNDNRKYVCVRRLAVGLLFVKQIPPDSYNKTQGSVNITLNKSERNPLRVKLWNLFL